MAQDRDRLTITLRKDLLSALDGIIDGVQIRNRSHAIEYLLSQSLGPRVRQAVILAGGQGVKMRPLTYEVPKPLIPVKGRPAIEYMIELLRDAGVRDIIVATGYLGEKIKEQIGSGQKYGVRVSYSEEHKPLGSAGALKQAESLIHSAPFLVVNGDILADIALADVVEFHQDREYVGTMLLTVEEKTKGFGMVQMRGDRVVKFIGRDSKETSNVVNAGMYVFNEEIFSYIPKDKKVDLDEIFKKLAEQEQLAGYMFEGDWFEISTPENYERAIQEWRKG